MSKKCNVRSFRFSDEVAGILHGFGSPESSLNDKFERLILHCHWNLPELDKKIKARQAELAMLDKEYRELMQKVYDQRAIGRELDGAMSECRRLKIKLSDINEKL